MLDYLCLLLIVEAVVVLLSRDVRFTFVYCLIVQSCGSTAPRGMLGYLCVLLMVNAVVNTALVGC